MIALILYLFRSVVHIVLHNKYLHNTFVFVDLLLLPFIFYDKYLRMEYHR